MTEIRMTKTAASPEGNFAAGKVYTVGVEIAEEIARRFVEGGAAEIVSGQFGPKLERTDTRHRRAEKRG